MSLVSFIILGCLICCHTDNEKNSDRATEGVFIISTAFRHPQTGRMVRIHPDDSIFYAGSIGIEKVMKVNELTVDDKFTSKDVFDLYYLIDFKKKQFAEIKSLDKIPNLDNEFLPFTMAKMKGLDFSQKLYNNESYTKSDTIINNKKYNLIRYLSMIDEFKGARMTLYLTPLSDGVVSVFPFIEETFKGRFEKLQVVTTKGEEAYIQLEFKQGLNEYWKAIFSKLL